MKRFFLILTLTGSSFFMSSYAAGNNTSPVVLSAFETSFTGAKDIRWEQVGVLYKANFTLNGQYASAFFNSDGELVAVTKNISLLELPKALQTNLKKELTNAWITAAFVVRVEGDDTYYVTLETADTIVTLRASGAKKWNVYQKAEK